MKHFAGFDFICFCNWDEKLYSQALSWVNDERWVCFVSDQFRESSHARIAIYPFESPLQLDMIAKKIAWSAVFKKLKVIGEGLLKDKIETCHLAANLILSDAAGYWVEAMQNARANDLPFRRGMRLKNAFANVPALIVGAGPSLEKNGHLIREFEDKALIFVGGTGLNAIDVEPHFAASIDPKAPFRQFRMHPFFETPFCYQSRMSQDNFSIIHGEKILFPDCAIEAINWIQGEETFFDGGWTVGNFLTEVAITFGCSPIFFIGMDLCYEKMRKYANLDVPAPDGLIQAREVFTQNDWLMAAQWIEEKSLNRKMYDLSQGILRLPKIGIDEAITMCAPLDNLKDRVFKEIQQVPLETFSRWNEWDESFLRCRKNSEVLEEEIVYQKLLQPLWQIWRPIFERENQNINLHEKLFFQMVLDEHEKFVLSER